MSQIAWNSNKAIPLWFRNFYNPNKQNGTRIKSFKFYHLFVGLTEQDLGFVI